MKIWADELNKKVQNILRQPDQIGDHENAHFCKALPQYLIKHVKWLPLWSGVCRDKFGFGRIPATSAEKEAAMNNIKNRVFCNYHLPMRPDQLLPILSKYFDGNCKIQIAKPQTSIVSVDQVSVDTVSINRLPQCPACNNGDFPTGAHK